jgi:hypothetical protein
MNEANGIVEAKTACYRGVEFGVKAALTFVECHPPKQLQHTPRNVPLASHLAR